MTLYIYLLIQFLLPFPCNLALLIGPLAILSMLRVESLGLFPKNIINKIYVSQ